MSIGGHDAVLLAPAQECVGDTILRTCQRHWEGQTPCFQNATDEVHVYGFDDSWVWTKGAASKEFFVYKNRRAVAAWKTGPTASNVNTMLYFIIGDSSPAQFGLVEIAVVFDKFTKEIKRFLSDLQQALLLVKVNAAA